MNQEVVPLKPHYEDGVTVVRIPPTASFTEKRDALREAKRISALHSQNTFWDFKLKEWVRSWNDRVHIP